MKSADSFENISGKTGITGCADTMAVISAPRPRRNRPGHFNPRPSWEGRLQNKILKLLIQRYFNPRPSWEGRHLSCSSQLPRTNFNPRPSGRDDSCPWHAWYTAENFNPRPSWEGRPGKTTVGAFKFMLFQSTSLVGGTTATRGMLGTQRKISIHVPRGRDDSAKKERRSKAQISIHVPRGRDDQSRQRLRLRLCY